MIMKHLKKNYRVNTITKILVYFQVIMIRLPSFEILTNFFNALYKSSLALLPEAFVDMYKMSIKWKKDYQYNYIQIIQITLIFLTISTNISIQYRFVSPLNIGEHLL